MALLDSLLALVVDAALGLWIGSIVFFSFVGAPQLFAVLPREEAGRAVNAIFPRYYVLGVGLGVVALAAGLGRGAREGFGLAVLVVLSATALGVALAAYSRWVLIPRMDAAAEDAFERLHRRSVILNGATLATVAAALVASHF